MQMDVRFAVARVRASSIFCKKIKKYFSYFLMRVSVIDFKITSQTLSVIESKLDVASSNTKMGESFKTALAIATLCFSPPDNFSPLSPT